MKLKHTLLAAGAVVFGTGSAQAGLVEEVQVGVTAHNICVLNCKNADKEDGPNINAEVVFASPDFLEWAFSPRPYLMASANTAGSTSFYGGGLQWRFNLTEQLSIDPGLGYVLHDGENSNPFPNGSPQATAFSNEHVLLGSDDLFRTSVSLHWQMTEKWGSEILFEHYSHGQILGEGRNQGMDNLGVRVTYSFD